MLRQKFVQTDNLKEAENECPWAAIIIKVTDGYMAFESMQDYHTWSTQK